jgi:hypothetical protein
MALQHDLGIQVGDTPIASSKSSISNHSRTPLP